MNSSLKLPEDYARQWEIMLLLLSSEENNIDRTCETEVDTMRYFIRNEGVRHNMMQWLHQMKVAYGTKMCDSDIASKCDNVSLLWRQRGNDNFRAHMVKDSYMCYTQSVLYARQDGPMYPLALANRSAALLRMKKYKDCLSDIALAIESGYPVNQRHKLLLRRADCYIELTQSTQAADALTEAIEHAKSLHLSVLHKLEFERLMMILNKKLEALNGEVSREEEVVLPHCFMGTNPNLNAASLAVELQRSDAAGRFVVTRESTKRGDVLFSEEPYAWVTLPCEEAVCEMCCQDDINSLPCTSCSRSVYCGPQCAARAQVAFHRWECVGSQSNLFPTIGIAHLALRVLLLTADEGFPALPRHVSQPATAADVFQSYSSVDNIQIYKADAPPFYRMFNLVTNFDKMNNVDYIQYALTASMLTLYLEQYTSFFEFLPTRLPFVLDAFQLRLFAAALMLRALGQLVCNGHATTAFVEVEPDGCENGRTISIKEVRRATAIYPSAAMLNHSCEPNIINVFYKNRLIIRCSRELEAGAEVLNCYGPQRARQPAAERRAQLREQYMFTCACSACSDGDRRDFALLFSAYTCQSCKGPVLWQRKRAQCQQCPANFHLERALATIDRAEELELQAERATTPAQRVDKLLAALRLKQQVWHRHHKGLREAADTLARVYANSGEFSKSVELIKQNVQSIEYQFGSFSIQVAIEMRKLSDIMLERMFSSPQNPDYRDWCLETHKILKKAVQLTELNYGAWHPLVHRLRAREAYVASTLPDSSAAGALVSVHLSLHYNLKI